MRPDQVLSLLGLAQKAGKVVSGDYAVQKAVKSGKAKVLIVASDASDATKKAYHDMTTYYRTPCWEGLSKEAIADSLGKTNRAAVAITDDGFSRAILKAIAD